VFSAIYIEEDIADHPRVEQLLKRFPDIPTIQCDRFGEVFNRKAQNFRLQKANPALILARKHGRAVLPAPAGYGFDDNQSFYFSHMLNCVYDCRYCFLQGKYRSANYVFFVNYEDFAEEIRQTANASRRKTVFYSGYDCDSLALEPVSLFNDYFVPLFAEIPTATLEIRTKSTQIRSLLAQKPISNCVIAMSFSEVKAAQKWEHKVPSLNKRLDALQKLQQQGWPVALRFEPIIWQPEVVASYAALFAQVFDKLDSEKIHSVSTGLFRMPVDYYKNIVKLYPDEALYARQTITTDGMIALQKDQETELLESIEAALFQFVPREQYYRCA